MTSHNLPNPNKSRLYLCARLLDFSIQITFVSGMLQPFSIVLVSRFTRRREGVVVVVGCGERTGVDKLGCRRESYQSLCRCIVGALKVWLG